MSDNIRVLIVDDSPLFRSFLSGGLSSSHGIEVVGTASNAAEARQKITALKPDVVTMDVEMPGLSGIDFLREFLPTHPVPVIVITSSPLSALDAISVGALDFVRKPETSNQKSIDKFFFRLTSTMRYSRMAKIRVPKPVPAHKPVQAPAPIPALLPSAPSGLKIVALGASTGGPDALTEVIKHFPANMPPVVITQHMPPTFTNLFAQRLDRISQMSAKEAEDGDRLIPGRIIVAAGGKQMRVKRDANGYYISSKDGEKVSGHCPSVDVLFTSVAEAAGRNAVAALLTGMGADGAEGLLKLKEAGAYTIGQDEESCVVYGMPGVAQKIGAVTTQLPLEKIGEHIVMKIK